MSPELLSNLSYGLDVMRRRCWTFGLVFLAILLAGIGMILLLPRAYVSEARILIDTPQISSPAIAGEPASPDSLSDGIDRIQQRITTRQRLLGLADTFGLFAEQRARFLKQYDGRKEAADAETAELVRSKIQITPVQTGMAGVRRTGLPLVLTVAFEYEDAETATKVTSAIVSMILKEDVRNRKVRASETARFIEREANRIRENLEAVDAQISSFSSQHRDALPDRMEFQIAELRSRQSQLDKLDADARSLADEERLFNFELRMKLSGQAPPPGGQSPSERLRALRAELLRRQAIFSDAHPQVRAAQQELAALEVQARDVRDLDTPPNFDPGSDEAQRAAAPAPDVVLLSERLKTVAPRRERIDAQRAEIAGDVRGLKEVIATFPEVKSQLLTLERQRTSIQASYDDIARKLAAAKLSEELEQVQQTERFEVLEPPVMPQYPARPNRKKLAALALLLALAGGGLGVAVLEFYAATVSRILRRGSDLGRVAGGIAVSVLPDIPRRRRQNQWLKPASICLVLTGAAMAGALALQAGGMPDWPALARLVGPRAATIASVEEGAANPAAEIIGGSRR